MQNHTLHSLNGKIERAFRTIKDNFVNCTDWSTFSSIEDLNEKYNNYIEEKYNNVIHSSINTTPKKRYMQDYDNLKFIPHDRIDIMFLHTLKRKVLADATISLNNIIFEVPQKYIKQRIQIKFDPNNLKIAYIYDEYGKLKNEIYPIDKIANSRVKRNELSFTNMRGEN